VLPIISLDHTVEKVLQDSLRRTDSGSFLALDPATAQSIISKINKAVENAAGLDGQPVLLCTPMVRPHLAQLLLRFIPTLPVISQAEIPPDIRLQSVSSVVLENAG